MTSRGFMVSLLALLLSFLNLDGFVSADVQEIASGETKTGNIASAGQIDSYWFLANAGDTVTILMGEESDPYYNSFAPQVELVGPGGTVGTAWGNSSARIRSKKVAQSGKYSILCQNHGGTGTQGYGAYGMSLLKNPGNATFAIQSGETKKGNIAAAGQMDAYSFTANAGDTMTILMGEENDPYSNYFAPQVELHAPDGSVLKALSGDASASISGQRLNQTGTYFIVCRDREGTGTRGYGAYGVSLLKNPGNATFAIQSGETKKGNISSAGQMDAYFFTANAGDTVTILMGEESDPYYNSFAPQVQLHAPGGSVLKALSGNASVSIQGERLNQTGTYFIVCRDSEGTGTSGYGAYGVSLLKNPGNATFAIQSGETKKGNIASAGQMDAYSFTANPGDTVTILMGEESDPYYNSFTPQVELHAPDGSVVKTLSGDASASISGQRLNQAGTYFIVCRDREGTGTSGYGAYGVSLAVVPGNPAPDLCLSKNHTDSFTVGITARYTLVVTNRSLAATIGTITLTDTLPAGLRFASGSGTDWSCSASGQAVTCTRTTPLAGGASSSVSLEVEVAGAAVPQVTNTATISTEGDTNPGNDTASDTTIVEGSVSGTATKVVLLKRPATDATTDYFKTLLISKGISYTEVSPGDVSGAALANSVIIAAFSAEPTEFKDVASVITEAISQGSWMIAEAFGRYIPHYVGIGSAKTATWNPVVLEKWAYVRAVSSSTLFQGLAVWDPPVAPDREEQYLYSILKTGSKIRVDYTYPSTGVSSADYWEIGITYGWTGQDTNSYYCNDWGGCSLERSVRQASVAVVHYGKGKLMTLMSDPIAAGAFQYGNAAGLIYHSFVRWGMGTASCIAPVITAQPQSPTIRSGQAVTLNVAATGTAPLSYQWYQGNSGNTTNPIAGATSSIYTTLALNATATYWVRVSNACGSVDGTTATVSVANIPAAPTNLQATTVSCNRIDLSWSDNSADETGFRIERKKGTSGTWSETAWVVANTQSYRDTGVSSSTAYYYRVWAYNEVGISAYSNEASATTSVPISITSQPASQTISSGQTATLSVAATGTAPLSYQWYRGNKGDTANPVGGATLNSYTTSILTATTTYWVRVTNLCGSVDSNAATITVVVAPAAPSNLVAAAVSSTRIDLTWKDNSNDETGFKIERKTELGGAWAETKTVSTNVQSYQDTGLTAGTTYYYRVRAYNAAGNSAYSNEAYATTCVPLSITSQPQSQAIQSAQQATLSVTVTGSAPLTYQWYRGKSGDTSNPISGATLSTYTTPALTATTTYWVRVSNPCGSVNSAGATVTVGEDVTITKRHVGKFVVGMKGLYQLTVKNVGATATSGTITVTDTLVTGLNYISATGEGWTCSAQGKTVTCTLSTSLAVGTSSEITLTVEVMAAAAPGVTNAATVAMSGDGNPDNNRAEDTAIVRSSEWTTYGPVGGTINGLALDPQKPDTIYASEDGSGVHKSTNAGSSWNLVLSGWWWGPLAIDPRDPATIYASRWPTTIYKSTDGGATWINASSGLGGTGRALTVDPGDPSTIYAGTDSGVFKTTSKAAAWSAVNSGLSDTDTYSLAIDSISPSVVYAGTYHRVYKSGNGGASWTVMSTGLPDSVVYALAIDPGDSTVVYAGTSKGVYKSGDAGVRWSAVNSGLSNLIVHAVVIDPLSRSTVYVGTEGGVYQTLTGGTSWTLVGSGLSNQKIYSLALDAERPSTLHAGTHGSGVYSITLIPASCAPPSITTHPQSQTIQSGQTATLSVTVAGTAPLFYQWYWGDKGDTSDSISGATSSTYTTPALTATTRYRVRVSNDCGSVESNAATITVGGPAVPSPPTNVVATAVSSSQIDLAWQDNSNDETGFKIERKTGASGTWAEIGTVGINVQSYQDKALAAGTTYYYRARAYNLAGNSPYSNEASATTSVACVPPSITTQPQSQTIQSGQTATLSVTAAGTAPLSYQWYRGNKGDTSNPISGATSNSYTTPALTATTSYWVRVSNDCGSVDSNAATVTVPQVPPPPTNLAATAVSSTRIDLSWNDNSSDETGFRIERKTGSLGAWAEIATVAPDVRSYQDTGLTAGTTYYYRVRAYNAAGNSAYSNEASATTSAACVPPSITTQPQSQTIQSGQTATLSVTAAGTAPLSYQWYRGNKGDTSNPISGATSNSYTTPALTATTSYWVRVSDSCSSVDSATAIVTVQTAPDLKITKSHSGNFTVGSSGAYMLAVTNVGTGATTGTITVIDTLPGGLSYVSATGVDWSCSASGQNVTCTRTNSLMTGATTIITLTAGVSSAAMPAVSNTASVATNGDTNSGNNTSADATTIVLPALPAVTVSGLGAVVTPASQQSITLSLAAGFPVTISGSLQLTFTPDTGISVDDPAILFVTDGRTVGFTIAANSTQALFSNNQTSVGVRTGTVAGTIDIRSTLRYLTTDLTPSPAPVCSGKVDKSPPVITDISASRTGSAGFRVVIVGYSTSRQMTEATFRFNCASDVDLTTPSIRVDLGQAFSAWYQGSESAQYGSMFSLTVDFTVSAHANAIIAVSATLTNAQGTSNEKSASF